MQNQVRHRTIEPLPDSSFENNGALRNFDTPGSSLSGGPS